MNAGRKAQSNTMKVIIAMLLFVNFNFSLAAAGRPKTKPGLFAATQVNSGQGKQNSGYDVSYSGGRETNGSTSNKNTSARRRLKHFLLHDYDNSLLPIRKDTENLRVKVGFTFRQVLDLDEKNQILKSLIWFRMLWEDDELSWNPDDFGGLKEIELPHNDVWRPDVVVYEEIGVRDYSPRLQKVKIRFDGEIEYREPTVFETTCSIDTAFFPFDVQVCFLTFVSWTDPVTKIDLSADRESLKLLDDAKRYFINTGEWRFVWIDVDKTVKDYDELLDSQATQHHSKQFISLMDSLDDPAINDKQSDSSSGGGSVTAENVLYSLSHEHKEKQKSEYPMKPQEHTSYTTLGNISMKPTMFSEVKYTIVVRRNSSLYMQSMLFPSILLTTVALLGFYLPPDSGERIGLQITILLTFMVFLLAVGEMFPASTGPYLGVYFVLCMGLLGVNLAMTVLVLHVHFKPVIIQDSDIQQKRKRILLQSRNRYKCCKSNQKELKKNLYKSKKIIIPKLLRRFLQFCDRYWSLKEYNARWLYETDAPDEESDLQNFSTSEDDSSSEERDDRTSSQQLFNSKQERPLSRYSCESKNENTSHSSFQNYQAHSVEAPKVLKSPQSLNKKSAEQRCSDLNGSDLICGEKNIKPKALIDDYCRSYSEAYQENPCDATSIPLDGNTSSATHVKNNGWKKINRQKPPSTIRIEQHKSVPVTESLKEISGRENLQASSFASPGSDNHQDISPFRHRILGVLNELKSHVKKSEKENKRRKTKRQKRADKKKREKEKEQEQEEMEQEEWKSVARAIDVLCFRFYVILIIISHFALFGAAVNTYLTNHT